MSLALANIETNVSYLTLQEVKRVRDLLNNQERKLTKKEMPEKSTKQEVLVDDFVKKLLASGHFKSNNAVA